MGTVSVWEDERVLWADGSDGCTAANALNATACKWLRREILRYVYFITIFKKEKR